MVVYQLREGGVKGGLSTLASHMGSESTVISPADVRAKVVAKLGDEGEAMIASQAIGFVKLAYATQASMWGPCRPITLFARGRPCWVTPLPLRWR